jgi:anti-anti-sigma factor
VNSSGFSGNPGLDLSVQTAGDITIAELTGELDIASASALRERLLSLLRPGSSRLVIDLSKVTSCDASGLAVLVNTGRRARLLGGFLHLAAVSPQVSQALNVTGLGRQFAIFPTVQAASAAARDVQHGKADAAASGRAAGAQPGPASGHAEPPRVPADTGEPRGAVTALTFSPAVAATATRLRRVLNPAAWLLTS